VPALTASANPQLNQSFDLLVDNSSGAWTVALLLFGLQQADLPTAWGGHLLVDPIATTFVALPPGGGAFAARVPPEEALTGLSAFAQALEIDGGASKRVSFTPGVDLVLGY